MKKIFYVWSLLLALVAGACNSTSSPVAKYLDLIDKKIEILEKISSPEDLEKAEIHLGETDASIVELIKENGDYQLSDKDKKDLKEKEARYLTLLIEKTAEYGGFSEEEKPLVTSRTGIYIEASNQIISLASNLRDLNGL